MFRDWPRDTFSRQQAYASQCFPADRAQRPQSPSGEGYGESTPRPPYPVDPYYVDGTSEAAMPPSGGLPHRPALMQIDDALRVHCGIAARSVFVAFVGDDGVVRYFCSARQPIGQEIVRQFFDAERYHQVMPRVGAGASPILDSEEMRQFSRRFVSRNRPIERRRASTVGGWESASRSGRKRQRARPHGGEDDEHSMTTGYHSPIKIGNSEAIWDFYQQGFKKCQQTACKLIAKAWIKRVEPKKQSAHPYTGSDDKAPEWWPKPWGPTKDDKVRHKEPDHLYKPERVYLLAHMLRLVMQPPEKQHASIQKVGLNVGKLAEAADEALSAFYGENKFNADKRKWIDLIFEVAEHEQRYLRDGVDSKSDALFKVHDRDSDESDTDQSSFVKKEENAEMTQPQTLQAAIPSRAMHSGLFLGGLPLYNAQYSHGTMADLTSQDSFVESPGLRLHELGTVAYAGSAMALEIITSPDEAQRGSRRPSVVSDFSSTVASMYPQPWPAASWTQNAPMYNYASQLPCMDSSGILPPNTPVAADLRFMAPPFDSGPRSAFDLNQSGLLRTGGISEVASGRGIRREDYMDTSSSQALNRSSTDSRAVLASTVSLACPHAHSSESTALMR